MFEHEYIFIGSSIEHWYGHELRKLTFLINQVANMGKGSYFLDDSLLLSCRALMYPLSWGVLYTSKV